ncbi:hypothetical protein [Sphingopyxis fribergensis]|nr:hypothetical protein [Sphingopyxis fribergensis]
MIENDEQLKVAVSQASSLVQEISDYVKANPRQDFYGRIRFPRGFIKTAPEIRRNLRFIENETLKRNVSYALMTHEVLRWNVFHTDLAGQAQEMLIKEAVCLLGNVCESITIFPAEHGLGRGSGFKKRTERLRAMDVIDDRCLRLLEWLWGKRNQEHLYDVPFLEWNHYEKKDWYKSVRAFRSLRDGLNEWRGFAAA